MGSRKRVIVLAIAASAMLTSVHPLEAPELELKNPEYARHHRIIPVPIMGIRGAVDVLKMLPGA
jgi:hypothetical protein